MRETSNITVEDAGIHHSNMVRDLIAELQESLQQEKTQTKTLTSVQAPVDHVANAVQSNQKQLSTQLQKIQPMMQTMQINYNAVPHGTRQEYCGRRYHGNPSSYRGQGGRW